LPQRDSFSHAATSQEQAPFLRSPPAHSPPRPRSSARWCRDKFLSRSVLREVGDLREYFRRSLRDGGFASGARGEGAENANAGVDGVVHACVMAGLAGGGENVARWSRAEGVFCGKDKVALHGSSGLSEKDWGAGGGVGRRGVFGEKFSGAKSTWLNMAAVVDPLAMLLVGGEGGGGGTTSRSSSSKAGCWSTAGGQAGSGATPGSGPACGSSGARSGRKWKASGAGRTAGGAGTSSGSSRRRRGS
jgi:hypothetical protein